jgi:hypothetical protein
MRCTVQEYDFSALPNPILYLGRHLFFIDSERNLELVSVALEIYCDQSEGKKSNNSSRFYGVPYKTEEVKRLLPLFDTHSEDSAEALGIIQGQRSGTLEY